MRHLPLPLGILFALLTASTASAQFVTPMRYQEGPGVKLTEGLVLHPGLLTETGFDSNVVSTNNELNSGYIRLIGHVDLSTLSPQRLLESDGQIAKQLLEFRLKSAVGLRLYFDGDDRIQSQNQTPEVEAGLLFKLFPGRMFSLALADDFQRTLSPINAPQGAAATPVQGVAKGDQLAIDTNRASAKIDILPGGGRLSLTPGYTLHMDLYENDGFEHANRLEHEVSLRAAYKFLPKSAVVLDATQGIYDYYDTVTRTDIAPNVKSDPLRVYLGFAGLLTPTLSAVLKVGYGNGFYDSGKSFSSVLAVAALTYRISRLAMINAGYERSFADSSFGNFFTAHRIHAGYDHLIFSRFVLHVGGELQWRKLEGFEQFASLSSALSGLANMGSVNSFLAIASAGLDYQIQDWLYVGAAYYLQAQNIDDVPGASNAAGLVDFVRHQVLGRLGVSY